MIEKICLMCNKTFLVDNYRTDAKYCSKACAYDAKRIDKTKTCIVCGKQFERKKAAQKYCSRACSWKAKELEEKECLNCKKLFKPYKSFLKFCSLDCSHEYHSGEHNGMYKGMVKYTCVVCGKTYYNYPSRAKRTKCCSEECRIIYSAQSIAGENSYMWTGGNRKDYRGPNWGIVRKQVLKRDGYKCAECGISQEDHVKQLGAQLSIHHIKPFITFDDYKEANKLSNLTTLCISCHQKAEHKLLKQGNIVPSMAEMS